MDAKNKNCAECTWRGRKCVREFHSESEWRRLDREREKIDREIRAAEEASASLFTKLARLRRQRDFLGGKSSKMLEHDSFVMERMDEEDPPGEEEIAELNRMIEEQEQSKQLAATAEALSPSFWVDCDWLLGENPVTGAGSSSGL